LYQAEFRLDTNCFIIQQDHTFFIVVAHIVVDHHTEVQQKVPRVFRYCTLIVVLQTFIQQHWAVTATVHQIINYLSSTDYIGQ